MINCVDFNGKINILFGHIYKLIEWLMYMVYKCVQCNNYLIKLKS